MRIKYVVPAHEETRFVVPVAVTFSIKYAAVHFMISFCSGTKVSQCSVQARGGIGASRNFPLPRRIYEDNLLNMVNRL